MKSWARLLALSLASASALPSSCVSAAGSPPLLPMCHSHSTCAIQLRVWIEYPSIEDPPLVRADALQMLCSHSVTVRCKCTQSAVECEAVRGAWPMACAGRARFMRLGRLDLTPSLKAFSCRAPSYKSLAAAPSALALSIPPTGPGAATGTRQLRRAGRPFRGLGPGQPRHAPLSFVSGRYPEQSPIYIGRTRKARTPRPSRRVAAAPSGSPDAHMCP